MSLRRPVRKVVCTIAAGSHRAFLEVTRPGLEQYADRHCYDLVVLDRALVAHRAPSWSKIPLLHDLATQYDVALWVDSDAVIVDGSLDVSDVMEPRAFFHVVEHNTSAGRIPNCGVIAVRGGALTRAFLERVWHKREHVQHEWWENAAVLDLLGYRLRRPVRPTRPSIWRLGVGRLDRAWNSIPADPSPSPRIVHFPGLAFDDRLARLRRAVEGESPVGAPAAAPLV
jgi:galactosyl transferase GMA12/MNN10 family